MIDIATLQAEVAGMLREGEYLVSVSARGNDQIRVVADAMQGLPIARCIEISRAITALHDRNEGEDYALEVSSPGLTDAWVVYNQYLKHIDAPVQAVDASGAKWRGTLVSVGPRLEDSEAPDYVVLKIEETQGQNAGRQPDDEGMLRIDHAELKRISYDIDKAL